MRPRRDVGASLDRLKTETSRPRPHPCSCHEHTTNLATGASRLSVLDCGTTFHSGFGGRDSPSILLDNLWKLISLATEAPSNSLTYRRSINYCIYLYMFYVKLWPSLQLISTHFSQSCRQTSDVTFADKRAAYTLFTTKPDELKRHSHWTGTNVSSSRRKCTNSSR